MKVSKETSERHRADLLRAAGRLLREKGFDKVGVAEIAAAAGLTHGAFYTHFDSKEALCAEAIARTTRRSAESTKPPLEWAGYIDAYLSMDHVRNRANGCPLAALAGDVPREAAGIRTAFSQGLDLSFDALARLIDGDDPATRDRAIVALATMVGGVVLARAASGNALRNEILAAVKTKLLDEAEHG